MSVCVCEHRRVYDFVNQGVHILLGMCRSKGNFRYQSLPSTLLETGSFCCLPSCTHELLGNCLSPLQEFWKTDTCYRVQLNVCSGDWSSDHYPYTTRALSTEPSSSIHFCLAQLLDRKPHVSFCYVICISLSFPFNP